MNKSRIQIAKPDIFQYFEQLPEKVFKQSDLARILTEQRSFWRLTQSTTTADFTAFLLQSGRIQRYDFPFPYRKEIRYAWGDVPLLEVLLTAKPAAYYSHYTAMRMHGLTEQVPKTIYLNHEQRPHAQSAQPLSPASLKAAFSRKPRISQNTVTLEDVRVCLINGMHTNHLGVLEQQVRYEETRLINVRLTDLERTLIDATVRPVYSGGVSEVLKAFRLARGKASVNRIVANLQKLHFVYPYHQAIGFYLERSGYRPSALDLVRALPREFDFYLTYQMEDIEYVKEWRLFIPKGL